MISALAYAKVNLYLHITGKSKNYHLLDSMVVFADIHDVVEVEPAESIKVIVKGDYADMVPADNSVLKAAEHLHEQFNIKNGAQITLQKNLPAGAGIGGGSADAAAAVKLLTRLWKINVSPEEMTKIALSLGADVPACLESTSLYMSGIGEILKPVPKLPKAYLLLVGTGKPLLTKDVYTKYNGSFSSSVTGPKRFMTNSEFFDFIAAAKNDLQDAAIELMPEIKTILSALKAEKDCLVSRMSGSGSTCFGLFAKRKFAEDVAIKLSNEHPSWWIRVANII